MGSRGLVTHVTTISRGMWSYFALGEGECNVLVLDAELHELCKWLNRYSTLVFAL